MLNVEQSALSPRHSALSTRHSALSTRHSALSTRPSMRHNHHWRLRLADDGPLDPADAAVDEEAVGVDAVGVADELFLHVRTVEEDALALHAGVAGGHGLDAGAGGGAVGALADHHQVQ